MTETFDYIIIGGGSAGCVLASRLSADPNCRVLLLEAGGEDKSPLIRIPGGVRMTIGNPRFDWMLMSEPDPTRKGRQDPYSRGKVLGGSSAINGMVYHRGPASDYDALAETDMPGWSFREVLPYFRMSEDFEGGADEYHGVGGPQAVSHLRTPHFLTTKFLEACSDTGVSVVNDTNAGNEDCLGLVHTSQRNGARVSTAYGYLRAARNRPNLTIRTRAVTKRLIVRDGRVEGVVYRRGDNDVTVKARRETILCAGTIMSPHILMHSGIGDPALLRGIGVAPVLERRDVGRNFHDHTEVPLAYEVNQSTYNMKVDFLNMMKYGLIWLLTRNGPVSTPGAQVTGVIRSEAGLNRPDLQLYFQPVGYRIEPGAIIFNREPSVQYVAALTHPKGRGEIMPHSPDPLVPPRIYPRLLEDESDILAVRRGLELGRRIMAGDAMKPYVVREMEPGPDVTTDAEWEDYIRTMGEPLLHAAGTCRMGVDDNAVVDSHCRVRGVQGLRVADMSIIPDVPGCNTNALAIMIGERCADFIRRGQ